MRRDGVGAVLPGVYLAELPEDLALDPALLVREDDPRRRGHGLTDADGLGLAGLGHVSPASR